MFLKAILDLVSKKKSGVLYLKTADNHHASIHLKTGDIIGVSYRVRRGSKAIDLIKGADIDSYRFDPDGLAVGTGDLPTTGQIIQSLAGEMMDLISDKPKSRHSRSIEKKGSMLSRAKPTASKSAKVTAIDKPFVIKASDYSNIEEMLLQFLTHELSIISGGDIAQVHKSIVKCDALVGRSNLSQTIQLISRDMDDAEKATAYHNKLGPWADLITGPQAVKVVNQAFTEFLGPMAQLIAADHINKMGGRISSLKKISELITRLSKELDGKTESQRFIALCYNTLFSFN